MQRVVLSLFVNFLMMGVLGHAPPLLNPSDCHISRERCTPLPRSVAGVATTTRVMLPMVTRSEHPPFYAFYYLWWSLAHWQEKLGPNYPRDGSWPLPGELDPSTGCGASATFIGSTLVDVPTDGAYDQLTSASDEQLNASIYATHIQQASTAGLTGFLAAWQGTGRAGESIGDSGYNKRLHLLVKAIGFYRERSGLDFRYAIDYETFHEIRTPTQIENDIEYLLSLYGDDRAWGRMDDRLMFYWHDTHSFPTETLQAIHDRFGDRLFIIGEERSTTWTPDRATYLDGTSHYWSTQDPYRNPRSFDQMRAFAAQVHADGKLWFAPLAPGYNDELDEQAQGNPVEPADCVPRKGVTTLRTLYEGNRASSPDGWFVISWNEWVEHTYIEPSRRYGTLYLDELSAIIHGSTSGSP
jgi:hypothetical protein